MRVFVVALMATMRVLMASSVASGFEPRPMESREN
ncbi:hypothetical protein AWB77_05539 [Caballeronia fortuita]|uniref:Uncharacterized protein n=1 Tax=Caballeronia fortuita TaxID=1777138 RepID=A0A158DNH8_9BURK|nr:hypothetical protein AWB77_05539 [Caballeronia fortuita]